MHEQFHSPQLIARGYQGTYQEVWRQWLESKEFTDPVTVEREHKWLDSQSVPPGPINQRWYYFYRSQGLEGTLDDMAAKWIVPEGGTQPGEGDPIPDPFWDKVVFFENFQTDEAPKGGPRTIVGGNKIEWVDDGLFHRRSPWFLPSGDRIKNGFKYSFPAFELDPVEGFTVDVWGKTIDVGPAPVPTWMELAGPDGKNQYFGSSDQRGFTTGGNIWSFDTTGANTIPHDSWTHVAYVFYQGQVSVYSEGVLLKSWPCGTTKGVIDSLVIAFRDHNGNYPWPFKGKLNELRITQAARWTENFTPPTGPVDVPTGPPPTLVKKYVATPGTQTFPDAGGFTFTLTGFSNTRGIGTMVEGNSWEVGEVATYTYTNPSKPAHWNIVDLMGEPPINGGYIVEVRQGSNVLINMKLTDGVDLGDGTWSYTQKFPATAIPVMGTDIEIWGQTP